VGQSFDLFDWNTSHGTFSQIDLPNVASGEWSLANLYTAGVIEIVPVPEPAWVLAWLGAGLTATAGHRRWRRGRSLGRPGATPPPIRRRADRRRDRTSRSE
jgi:hypothetical protein